ncbi:MAG: phytanoyl-CoA dioxygenase family protein [Deltaproteobacteria bacterium]|nr:phytanoyl-CoA dioxygenase family protein [Deltaproteobacteria bacterium]
MPTALSADEQRAYARDGYLLRRGVFAADELAALRAASEDVIALVVARATRPEARGEVRLADGHRLQFAAQTIIQWEWREDSPEVRLIEPFTHLDARFAPLWGDARLTAPAAGMLGVDAVDPFTCKLNLKRPREGSPFPWHQDYPYWYVRTPATAHEIVTAMLFLDDATAANGALRVLPGSHRDGPAPRDRNEPTGFLADPARIDAGRELMIEAPAGSLLLFPALLLHRSGPNTSDTQRRAILLSFQPAGRPRQEALPWEPERVSDLP